jgi:hypothetical protein
MYRMDPNLRRIVAVVGDDIERYFYAGAWVTAVVRPFKSNSRSNPGIFLGLNGLFFLCHDRKFGGGGGASADDFADVSVIEDPNARAEFADNPWGDD